MDDIKQIEQELNTLDKDIMKLSTAYSLHSLIRILQSILSEIESIRKEMSCLK